MLAILGGAAQGSNLRCEDNEATAALTVDVACNRIPATFGVDPRRDVHVLPPLISQVPLESDERDRAHGISSRVGRFDVVAA